MFQKSALVAQLDRALLSQEEVAGSSPARGTFETPSMVRDMLGVIFYICNYSDVLYNTSNAREVINLFELQGALDILSGAFFL